MSTGQPKNQNSESSRGLLALLASIALVFKGLRLTILVLFIGYLFSGIFVVHPEQKSFILRFGSIVKKNEVPRVIESGRWNWAWPKPIDEVVHVPVKRSKTISLNQFWYDEESNFGSGEQKNSTEAYRTLVPGVDGYLLTGDKNIVHTKWSLTYLISEPIRFHTRYAEPEKALLNGLESAVLHCVSQHPVDHVLYRQSEQIRNQVFDILKRRFRDMEIGVTIQNITYDRKETPRSTNASFEAVQQADQQRENKINLARSYAFGKRQNAIGFSSRIVAGAEQYRSRIVADVEADMHYFSKIIEEYRKSPDTMMLTLYSETLSDVLKDVHKKFVIHTSNNDQQEIRLLLDTNTSSTGSRSAPKISP